MSEGVTEIQINNQSYKGINLTAWHTQARRAPRVATIHDVTKSRAGSYLTLVPSSTRIPQRTHRGWLEHYPIMHSRSEVRYHPTPQHTKLLSLGILCLVCVNIFQMLVQQDSTDMDLNRHRWGLPPWSFEYQTRPLPFLPIQYSPFSTNCPVRSPIMPTIRPFC
jgi:hypothetical protein